MRSLWMMSVVGLCACGGGSGSGDIPVELAVRCKPASTIEFVDTQIGQTSFSRVFVTATDGDDLTHVKISVDGPDAREFSTSSACESGATPGFCIVQVSLAPTSTGAKSATLHIGDQSVPLTGKAIAASTGLRTSVANIDIVVGPNSSSGTMLTLDNLGSAPIALAPAGTTIANSYAIATAYGCPLPITQGGACSVSVSVVQSDSGCVDATLHFGSDTTAIDVPVSSTMVTIADAVMTSQFGGTGVVTSDVGALACRGGISRCAAHVDASSITYTATPDAGSVFNGWSELRCGRSPTCSYPIGPGYPDPTATADFEPATMPANLHAIHVAFAGDGTGVVRVGDTVCSSSCTAYVADGAPGGVSAVANSQFGGFSGACIGTSPSCDLGTIVHDRDVTVTFTKDAPEVSSVLVPLFGPGRYLAGGDRIVVAAEPSFVVVTRLSGSTTVWSRALFGALAGQAVTAGGSVYVLVGAQPRTLVRIGADGAVQWRVDAGTGSPVAAAGEDAALAVTGGVEIRAAGDGSIVRTLATAGTPGAVAVAADGTVAVALGDQIQRFASDGSPLPATPLTPTGLSAALAYDAAGVLFVLRGTSGELIVVPPPPVAKLTRITPDGNPTYTVDLDVTGGLAGGSTGGGAIAVAADGTVVTLRVHVPFFSLGVGAFVEAYDNATGTRKWQVDKLGVHSGPGAAVTGFLEGMLLAPPAGGIQLLGIRSDTGSSPVLETFSL